ncbi:hypothetical protein [Streptomyces sp. JW3]|uniref:hypothetical protein n=1 Tax=Streptomyces sp. JW3 TaxID=3456955 RepID=UPI003FA406D5
MRDVLVIGGVIFILLGIFAVFAQTGNFVDYRRMRHLKLHGVDGQAVYVRHEYVTNSHRVFFDVCLPEGEAPARFHEYMQGLPGPRVRQSRSCMTGESQSVPGRECGMNFHLTQSGQSSCFSVAVVWR